MCAGDRTMEPREETDASGNIMEHGVDAEVYQHERRDTWRLWEIALQSEECAVEPSD